MTEIDPVLQRYPPDCHPSQIDSLGSAGGMSGAQFWRITTSVVRGSPDPARTLLLRRWPKKHPPRDRLQFIHDVLHYAANRGITILPLPISARDGQTVVEHAGHLWELTPWLPGAADYEPSPSTDKLRAALTALAEFHLAAASFSVGRQAECLPTTTAPAVTRRLTRLHQLAHGGIQQLSLAINDTTWPDLAPLAHQFLAALPRAVPRAIAQLEPLASVPLPLQPCIRDIWHNHVLFTGNDVTGLVDFGALDIDTPATDVARLLGSLVPPGTVPFSREGPTNTAFDLGKNHEVVAKRGLSPSAPDVTRIWRDGLAAYSAIRPLSREESLAVFALDASGTILAGCNWIRWLYIDRRQFENHTQAVDRFRSILARTKSMHE